MLTKFGIAMAAAGLLYLCANYTILVEGHRAVIAATGENGAPVLDNAGQPVFKPNPDYERFARDQRLRTSTALGLITFGLIFVTMGSLRSKKGKSQTDVTLPRV